MSPFALLLLAAVLIGNSGGQLMFKAAALRAETGHGLRRYWLALGLQPMLWLGMVVYVAEFFLWLAFLSVVPLWQGVMVASVDILLEGLGRLLIAAVIIWVVGRAVISPGRVTYHRVIGAVLLYLAIGLLFVGLYTLNDVIHPGSFSGMMAKDELPLPSDFIYFSFTILTTVGFGDVVPVHPIARSLTNIEAIIGQLYPATLLAYLVSLDVAARR